DSAWPATASRGPVPAFARGHGPRKATVPAQSWLTLAPACSIGSPRGGGGVRRYKSANRLTSFRRPRSGASKHAERFRHTLDCLIHIVVVDVEMRDGAEDAGVSRRREPNPFVGEPGESVARLQVEFADVDLDEVRLDLLEVDRDSSRLQTLGQPPGPLVVIGQPLHVVV